MKFILSKNDFDFTKFAVKTSNVGRWEDCDLSESIQGVSYLGQLLFFFSQSLSASFVSICFKISQFLSGRYLLKSIH